MVIIPVIRSREENVLKTIEYARNPVIDREGWPTGPWDNEPDKVQWRDETTGFPCLIVRNRMGGLCGYVGVPRGHRFYEVDYDNVSLNPDGSYDEDNYPPAHGGLTYASKCQVGPEDQTICHVVEPGEDDDVFWLGFDCGHWMDLQPRMVMLDRELGMGREHGSYKDIAYVKRNVEELAAWLKENS